MDLITDIPTIERRCRENEDQDMSFRTYLKISSMSDRRLDEIVRDTTDDVWSQIDCTTCANCCRTLDIPIDDEDCAKLAVRLCMTTDDFKTAYVKASGDPQMPMILANKPCSFLGDDNRCTVYADRPKDCQDYPYLRRRPFRQRTFMMIENAEVCPIVFNVWQSLKQQLWRRGRRRR